MRVIAGSARGRRLGELKGSDTRPTTDKVKESLFNILQFDLEGRKVLDLFAGTGQLGIEALSRGADSCVFVDTRRDAAALIRDNLKATDLTQRGKVVQGDSLAYLQRCGEKFDLILLDPPYAGDLLPRALETIASIDILREYGIIACESDQDRQMPELAHPYEKGREYRYGQIKLTIYRRAGSVRQP